jgi:hypothetical protein
LSGHDRPPGTPHTAASCGPLIQVLVPLTIQVPAGPGMAAVAVLRT